MLHGEIFRFLPSAVTMTLTRNAEQINE